MNESVYFSRVIRKRGSGFIGHLRDTGKWFAYRPGYGEMGYFDTLKEANTAYRLSMPRKVKKGGSK